MKTSLSAQVAGLKDMESLVPVLKELARRHYTLNPTP